MLAGINPRSRQRKEMAASVIPAAASVWPVHPLVETALSMMIEVLQCLIFGNIVQLGAGAVQIDVFKILSQDTGAIQRFGNSQRSALTLRVRSGHMKSIADSP